MCLIRFCRASNWLSLGYVNSVRECCPWKLVWKDTFWDTSWVVLNQPNPFARKKQKNPLLDNKLSQADLFFHHTYDCAHGVGVGGTFIVSFCTAVDSNRGVNCKACFQKGHNNKKRSGCTHSEGQNLATVQNQLGSSMLGWSIIFEHTHQTQSKLKLFYQIDGVKKNGVMIYEDEQGWRWNPMKVLSIARTSKSAQFSSVFPRNGLISLSQKVPVPFHGSKGRGQMPIAWWSLMVPVPAEYWQSWLVIKLLEDV